jgi:predicted ATPase/class 3 adenylate cyclase
VRCPACDHESPPDARFCSACGKALEVEPLPPQKAPLETGERRQLTVLFCDLVGSTELSTRLDAEELAERMRSYQSTCVEVIERFGGHVAQYLGDGILVYFGYPQAHDDDAERAVRAGLGLVEALAGQSAVRIGIHTGPVVVQAMGSGEKRETLALGETTNLAARLQALAAPDTLLLSEATRRLVRGIFVLEPLGAQRVKGFAEPVLAHRAVRPTGVRSRLDLAAGRLTPLVGRELELATLVDRFERAADGEGQNVLVLGEAGVGKSRLAYQLRERLASIPHTWLESRATPYTERTPFFPVIELLAQGLAFAEGDAAADKITKLERGLAAVGFALAEALPLLADLLGLPAPEGYARLSLSPEARRRNSMQLLAAWCLALSELQPLVILSEDLHWSDPSSLELLGRIVEQSATARVLLLATARPEFTAPWPARSNLLALQLARLTRRQAQEMVGGLGGGGLSAAMVDALVARAGGVPLYVEELTKAVTERGATQDAAAIPATLADSLMGRLDRLSSAKEVAQRAAVLGREFSYTLLAGMAGLPEAALRAGLARLVEAEILFARGEPPVSTYSFKHALVQEAAYESLLRRTRQELHGRVVDVLTTQLVERAEAEPELVARHAEAAGRIDEAIAHYQRAGERAQARSAHSEAILQLRHAIELVTTQPESAERDGRELTLQAALGASLQAARGYAHAETEAAYERAGALAERSSDPRRLGLARIGLATFYTMRGEVERGRVFAAGVLAEAEARGDEELKLSAHAQVALAEYYQGEFTSSLQHAERAFAPYDPPRHREVVALDFAALSLWQLGRADSGLARAEEASALARRLDHALSLAAALVHESAMHELRRDSERQRERAAELIALSETHAFPFWLGMGRFFHGLAHVAAGDISALSGVLDGLARTAGTGSRGCAPAFAAMLAEAQRSAGRLAEAQGSVAGGFALSAQTGQRLHDAELHRLEGELLLAQGGTPDAVAERYQQALATARAQGSRAFELRAATSLARLWNSQGKSAEARALLAPIYEWFTEGHGTLDLIEAKALLDELR